MWYLAAMIMADSGSAWPGNCRRWLPMWLPEISLSSLTFDGAKTVSIKTLPMHTAYSRRAITAVVTDAMPCMPDTDRLPSLYSLPCGPV